MANAFEGIAPQVYPFSGAGQGANNKSLNRAGQGDGVIYTSTCTFGTSTTDRFILVKPGVDSVVTASPIGIAAQGFGWNLPPLVTNSYRVLEEVTNSMMGLVNASPPTVIASPSGGAFGNAFDFDGLTPSGGNANEAPGVNFGTSFRPANNAVFTLDVRFRRDRTGVQEFLASWGYSASGRMGLYLEAAGTNRISVAYNNGGGPLTLLGTTSVTTGVHTARVTYDGTTLRLYLDGVLESSIAQTILHAGEFWIGRWEDPTNPYPLDGAIDEVRVSNNARSTGASYTVDTAPFTVDANTTFLTHCEALVPVRRVLKAGSRFYVARIFLTFSQVDALFNNTGIYINYYKRTAAGTYTLLNGAGSGVIATPVGITAYDAQTPALPADVVFNQGDHLHLEVWVRARGGGTTGLLSQVVTVTVGDPTVPVTDEPDTAAAFTVGGFRYLFDQAPTAAIAPSSTIKANYSKNVSGAFSIAQITATLKRTPLLFRTGSITPSATLKKTPLMNFAGAIATTGTLIKTPIKYLTGTITSASTLIRTPKKLLLATITPTSTVKRNIFKTLLATITPIATNKNTIVKHFFGFFYSTGEGGGGTTIIKKFFHIFDD